MRFKPLHVRFAAVALLVAPPRLRYAQPAQKPFEPLVGQPGKDVVWVPTSQALVDKMLDMAKVTRDRCHMDLGSGDGRTVITAAKRGARATGIEYNPDMVELSKANAAKAGVTDKATFVKADLFETDFSQGHRDNDVPAARHQSQAAAKNTRPETRHAHRVQYFHDGRMEG